MKREIRDYGIMFITSMLAGMTSLLLKYSYEFSANMAVIIMCVAWLDYRRHQAKC